ncbi:MAG: PAS domain-containing protein [Rhodopirellula sp.]|nr:PAS domain-containing protein [Rhodopirellula sp.]
MSQLRLERTAERRSPGSAVALSSAILSILLGLTALAGWHFNIELWTRGLHRLPVIQSTAALAFVLTGAGMAFAVFERRLPAMLCGGLVAAAGLVSLAENLLRIDVGIDRILLAGARSGATIQSGRIDFQLSLCLVLMGAGVAIMPQRETFRQRPLLLVLLGTGIFGLGITGFIGAVAPYQAVYSWIHFPRIALPSAIALMSVGMGMADFGWRRPRRSEVVIRDLRNSIIIYTTFGMLLMIVVSALLAVLPIYDKLRDAQQNYFLHATRSKAGDVEQYLWRIEAIARQISSRTHARRLFESYLRQEITKEEFAAQSKPILLDALAGSNEARGITRADKQGNVLVTVGAAIPRSLWPKQTLQIDSPVFNGPLVYDGTLQVTVAATIRDANGRPIGVDIVLTEFPDVGRILADGSGLGIDSRMVLQAEPDGQRASLALRSRDGTVVLTGPDESHRLIAAAAARRSDGLLDFDPAREQPVLEAYASVEGPDWFILSTVKAVNLYYPVNRQLAFVLAVVGVLATLGALGIYLLLRPLTGVILIQTDLLEKRICDATEALARSEERFDLAVRGTDAGIWDWDLRSNHVYFSPRWKSMLGYGETELSDDYREWESRLHPDDRDRALEAVRAYRSGETPHYELEHRLRHKDGRYRWILARGKSVRDAAGRPYRMVGSHIDVTDRKLAEERLENTAAALTQSNRDLEQFAYIASHDLQEPLRMMSSYLQTLAQQHRDNLPANAQSLIDLSLDSGRRMEQLIHDLLAYSRVQTREVRLRPIDCNEVFEHAVENLKLAIKESSARVTGDDLPEVIGDYTQLVQLLQNLIGNGIKFRGEEAPRVHVSARRREGQWTFAVEDNGIGIDAEYAATIFEVFQRLHTSEQYPGTGIGLAVCKRIVERHGGKIWFESEAGRGAVFYFTLPAVQTGEESRSNDSTNEFDDSAPENREPVGDPMP